MELLRMLLQQASATVSRSTTLQPLLWFAALFIAGLLTAVQLGAAPWIIVSLMVGLGITFVVAIGFFIYYGIHKPDLLRSERFLISKMVIEQNLMGDAAAGLTKIPEFQEIMAVTEPTEKQLTEGKQ